VQRFRNLTLRLHQTIKSTNGYPSKKVYDDIAQATSLATSADKIQVEQTPTFLKEPIKVADFAVGVVAALGAHAAEIGEARGLPSQDVSVDRRHAALSLNDGIHHYMNGVVVLGGEIMVPVNGFYQARDGKWMCFNGAYPHLRDGILKYFDAPHDQAALIKKVAEHDSAEIEADFEKLGLCMAPMMSHQEWLAHPQGQAMSDQPVVQVKRLGDAKQRVLPEAKHRPLEGVRVIDVTHVIAGPWSTRVLADHGADVISVRNPAFPFLYPAIFEESYGKKQILLHLGMEKSKARFAELIKDADVLVWGYAPGSLDRLGFTREALMELNPNLVLTHVTAYGPTGPWSKRKGWEQLSQTCSGMVELASQGRDQHHLVAALPCDYGTGYLAAIGAISALRQRQEQGGFWDVHAALTRTAMEVLSLPHESEQAVPTSLKDDGKYFVDQDSNFGAVFTRLAPAARLSKTPAYSETGPAINGAHDPFLTGWNDNVSTDGVPKHRPSERMKQGIYGFLEAYGHEDIMLRKS
jgi:crotonobetainyl-CoA:carnitine CoA-transferase CaiB-like acyl-CoA transferase